MPTRWTAAVVLISVSACSPASNPNPHYVVAAVEDDSAVAILDGDTGALLQTISLNESMGSEVTRFSAHNVQVDAAARMAWVTAPPDMEPGASMEMDDELIGIDLQKAVVTRRISLGRDQHVAHVVTHQGVAWVTANEANAVLRVDLEAGAVTDRIVLPADTMPHGLRVTPDGKTLVLAGIGAGAAVLVDTDSRAVRSVALPGRGVQAAVSSTSTTGYVTVYDTRQVAKVDLATAGLTLFDLPTDSAGPLQLYPTPDGTGLWVADQGMLDGQPAGDRLFLIDAKTGALLRTAKVGAGPHGVVVSPDGKRLWTTTLVNGTVDTVDTQTGEVLTSTAVGKRPNGISCAHVGGAMP